jgi:hypothetical protein
VRIVLYHNQLLLITQRHLAQYHKLSKMVADLRESEGKLQAFLPSLDKDFEPKVQESKSRKSIVEVTATFMCASCVPRFKNMNICRRILAKLTMHVAH